MPGGTVTITADSQDQLKPVIETVLCWALTDKHRVRTSFQGRGLAVVIPEEIIAGKGALNLRIGGADVVAGYVAGSHITVAAGNSNPASSRNVNTCAAKGANGPQISYTVAGRVVTVTVNNAAAGTVSINWGDGTANSTGVAQNGTPTHTYAAPGSYTVTVTDEDAPTAVASFVVVVPSWT